MTLRPLEQPRADALATMLDLDLDAGICHACLSFVSLALDEAILSRLHARYGV